MAVLTPQHTLGTGLSPTWAAAAAAGDSYPNTGAETLQVRNQGSTPIVVTVPAQTACSQGSLHTLQFTVPAAGLSPMLLGPFQFGFYNDVNGRVNATYSKTSLLAPGSLAAALLASSLGLGVGVYRYAVTFVNGSGETTGGTEVSVTTTAGFQVVKLDGIPLGPGGTTSRKIYRTSVGGAAGSEKLLATLGDNTTQSFTDSVPDTLLGASLPGSNTAGVPAPGAATAAAGAAGSPNGAYKYQVTFVNVAGETTGGVEFTFTAASTHVSLTSVPIGPSGTTSRKIYRTAAAGASGTEKLVGTIADNTTTTFDDNVADGSLGAAIPTTNTANVVQVAVTAA
jgi:hypothetical protein